jgi:hypothetical protein
MHVVLARRTSLLEPFLLFNLFSYNLHLMIKNFCLKQNLRKFQRRASLLEPFLLLRYIPEDSKL